MPRRSCSRASTPRTIRTHARTHVGAPTTVLTLAAGYAGRPDVTWHVVENATGRPSRVRDLRWLDVRSRDGLSVDALRATLQRRLEKLVESRRIGRALARVLMA